MGLAEKHDFEIEVEPLTGMAMGGAGRLQVNLQIQPLHYQKWLPDADGNWAPHTKSLFSKLRTTFMPVAWMEDGGLVSEAQASEFHGSVGAAVVCRHLAPWIFVGVGVLLLMVAGAFH